MGGEAMGVNDAIGECAAMVNNNGHFEQVPLPGHQSGNLRRAQVTFI
jgi:hypothetical protein